MPASIDQSLLPVTDLVVVLGPTASGKSALAMSLARSLAAEILSVDSMQVYEGMDIGTAKPSAAERAEVPHHLLDVVRPNETFTAARFVELADPIIESATKRNKPLIATGGTPLYYKALFQGLFEGPSADPQIRQRLSAEEGQALHQRLALVDPLAASRIHPNDRKRLIRALEVFELTGKPISSLQTTWTGGQMRHSALWIGLQLEQDALNRRINARTRQMMEAGWLDETRQLLQTYGRLSTTANEATGYRELSRHLVGEIPLADAIEQIKISTRQLARRQMKWFRRFPNVHWLRGDRPLKELTAQATEIRGTAKLP